MPLNGIISGLSNNYSDKHRTMFFITEHRDRSTTYADFDIDGFDEVYCSSGIGWGGEISVSVSNDKTNWTKLAISDQSYQEHSSIIAKIVSVKGYKYIRFSVSKGTYDGPARTAVFSWKSKEDKFYIMWGNLFTQPVDIPPIYV